MSAALVLIRVDRGAPCPDLEVLRAALREDRRRLAAPAPPAGEVEAHGPYPVRIGDRDLDEYVVWER